MTLKNTLIVSDTELYETIMMSDFHRGMVKAQIQQDIISDAEILTQIIISDTKTGCYNSSIKMARELIAKLEQINES